MSDDDFWNKRATILKYQKKMYNSNKRGETIVYGSKDCNEELFETAKSEVGPTTFAAELERLNISSYFVEFTEKDRKVAFGIGAIGAFSAILLDANSKKIEAGIKKNLQVSSSFPGDLWPGKEHRYKYGHDLLNPFQKLPDDIKLDGLALVNDTLFSQIKNQLGPSAGTSGVLVAFLKHLLSDLPTNDGLPMPGSSYFTKWKSMQYNISGFSADNQLMGSLGREYGAIRLSDMGSTTLMWALLSGYCHQKKKNEGTSILADSSLFRYQLNITAYAACLALQTLITSLLVTTGAGDKLGNPRGNMILITLLVKDIFNLLGRLNSEHKQIMITLDNDISVLKNGNSDFDDYVRHLLRSA